MKKHIAIRRLISCLITLVLLISSISILSVQAAEYSGGSGTRQDPYLIKTPDDLYNMRNNLDAYFKLAATIDMKGYKTDSKYFKKGFVPIGDDSTKPFTGSFVCDLGSDGLPLYAILNLKIYNAKGDIYNHDYYGPDWWNKDYPGYPDAFGFEAPYYYETGLFGTIKGAQLTNIYVLNADVYSSIVGQGSGIFVNGVEANYISYAKFMDTQATAILAGVSIDSAITHCAVTGKAEGKSSHSGAFIGNASGTTIVNSYADADVKYGGWWHNGHFIGDLTNNSSVKNSFSLGTFFADSAGLGKYGSVKGGSMSGFIEKVENSTVSDCYSGVKVLKGSNAQNFVGTFNAGSTMKNCLSYGDFEGNKTKKNESPNLTNCFISNESTGKQASKTAIFKSASVSEINSYFLSQKGWAKGEKYPVLTDTHYVKNGDKTTFVPGVERIDEVVSVTVEEKPEATEQTDKTEADETVADGTVSQEAVADGTVSEETVADETVADGTEADETGTAQQGTVTTQEVVPNAVEEPDIIQIVLMTVLIIMIAGISALTVVMVLTTLHKSKKNINDDIDSSSEGE